MTILPDPVADQAQIGKTHRARAADRGHLLIAAGMTAMIAGVTGIIVGETATTVGVTATAGETHRVIRAGVQATTMTAVTGIRTGTTTAGTIAGAGT
jgi:hypothetical protein